MFQGWLSTQGAWVPYPSQVHPSLNWQSDACICKATDKTLDCWPARSGSFYVARLPVSFGGIWHNPERYLKVKHLRVMPQSQTLTFVAFPLQFVLVWQSNWEGEIGGLLAKNRWRWAQNGLTCWRKKGGDQLTIPRWVYSYWIEAIRVDFMKLKNHTKESAQAFWEENAFYQY